MDKTYVIDKNDHLGQGSYGCVFKGSVKATKTPVAIKRIENAEHLQKSTLQEIKCLKCIKNPNVVELFDVYEEQKCYWIVLEFCNRGDLERFLKYDKPNLHQKVDIMLQCASAMSYLHNQKPCIVHRDLKLNNILLKSSGKYSVTVKVCDFGLSKILEDGKLTMMTDTGTLTFRAPELLCKKDGKYDYTASVDTFALGIVFKIMLDLGNETENVEPTEVPLKNEPEWMMTYGMTVDKWRSDKRKSPALFVLRADDSMVLMYLKVFTTAMTSYLPGDRPKMEEVKVFIQMVQQYSQERDHNQKDIMVHHAGKKDIAEMIKLENHSKYRDQIELMETELKELKEINTHHQIEKHNFQRKAESMWVENAALSQEVKQLKSAMLKSNQRHTEEIQVKKKETDSLGEQVHSLQQDLNRESDAVSKAKAEYCELKQSKINLQRRIERRDTSIVALTQRHTEKIQEKNQKIDSLGTRVHSLQQKLKRESDAVSEAKTESSRLQAQLTQCKITALSDADHLQKEVKERDASIFVLKQSHRKEIEDKETEVHTLKKENDQLEKELQSLRNLSDDLQNLADDREREFTSLSAETTSKEDRVHSLEAELLEKKESEKRYRNENCRLQNDYQEKCEELQNLHHTFDSVLMEKDKKLVELTDRLSSGNETKESKTLFDFPAYTQLRKSLSQLPGLTTSKELSLQDRVHSLEAELLENKESQKRYWNEHCRLQNDYQEKCEELQNLHHTFDSVLIEKDKKLVELTDRLSSGKETKETRLKTLLDFQAYGKLRKSLSHLPGLKRYRHEHSRLENDDQEKCEQLQMVHDTFEQEKDNKTRDLSDRLSTGMEARGTRFPTNDSKLLSQNARLEAEQSEDVPSTDKQKSQCPVQ